MFLALKIEELVDWASVVTSNLNLLSGHVDIICTDNVTRHDSQTSFTLFKSLVFITDMALVVTDVEQMATTDEIQ